jgi:hypothetical protein
MAKYKEFSGKMSVGLFVEGHYLHVVCVANRNKQLQLVDAQTLQMSQALETVRSQQQIYSDAIPDTPQPMEGIDDSISIEGSESAEFVLPESEAESYDNIEILQRVLYQYPSNKFRMGIAVSEPQIYYMYFATDWGLQGEKLRKKVLQEVIQERKDYEVVPPDALYISRLRDGRLMAIVRDSEVNVINSLQYLHRENRKSFPKIVFVESAETSLVNLINENYLFEEEDITVVVYLGNEYSRLIYLQGHEIYSISYIIGAGLDSENITHTIYSRILLEQDNLNIPKVQNIILTGEAYQVQLKEFLKEKLSENINIDYLQLPSLEVLDDAIDVSKYATAIGSAWRCQNVKAQYLYPVDLLPVSFREGQKRFKLGFAGWMLLLLLPTISYFSTQKVSQLRNELAEIIVQKQYHKEELDHLRSIEAKLNEKRAVLKNYEKAFGVLDEMSIGIDKWNKFLYKLSKTQDQIGRIWITDISPASDNTVTLKGFSVYRDRIPRLSQAMGDGNLKTVMVESIRDRTLYQFEMKANLPND